MIKICLATVFLLLSTAPGVAAIKAATPEARVKAFISDYVLLHAEVGKASGDANGRVEFRRWHLAAARLEKAHFVGDGLGLAQVMNREPEYLQDAEILRTTHLAGGTRIEIRAPEGAGANFHEFELREMRHDWRIVRIRHYFKGIDEPFMTPDQRPRFETPGINAWGPPIDSDDSETLDFRDGQTIYTYNAAGTVQVRRVGTLNVTSGNLVVGKLGYSTYYLSPIGQRIPPGQYPVEVAIGFESIAAVRVVVSNEPVVTWHSARMVSNPGTGLLFEDTLITIADASSVLTANGRHVELIVDAINDSTVIATGQMATLVNANDAVIWTEWFGNAGHGVFWGADASGKPAVLLVNYSLDDTMDIE
jgi:hypothetical protein